MQSRQRVLATFDNQQNVNAVICIDIIKPDQTMPCVASRLRHGFHRFSLDFKGLSIQTTHTAIVVVAEAPAGNSAPFFETYETAPHRFVYGVRANHELRRQVVC
jgi:hypothetical protein